MSYHYAELNPDKALIWRITHRSNLPWILANGLHAGASKVKAKQWFSIGNEELINRRAKRFVPLHPGGVLNDYVPFYFTPFSPMMYNIHTGRGGVCRLMNEDIIILVSSLYKAIDLQLSFVFTDRHAYPSTANYFNDINLLDKVDWLLLQQRNFQRDPNDPEKVERYQAEALIYQHVPIQALLGVICYNKRIQSELQKHTEQLGGQLKIYSRPNWYF